MGRVTGDRARAVYELRVTDASAADRQEALLKSLLVSLLDHSVDAFAEKIEVHIVDRPTDEIVWSRRTGSDVARLLAIARPNCRYAVSSRTGQT